MSDDECDNPLRTPADFERAFRKYGMTVQTVCRIMCCNMGNTLWMDVCQEAWMKAWKMRSTYDLDRPLGPWLRTIARNCALDALRKPRTNELANEGIYDQAPPDDSEKLISAKDMLLKFFDSENCRELSYRERLFAEIVIDAVVQDKAIPSDEELAILLECSRASVPVFRVKWRAALKVFLDQL